MKRKRLLRVSASALAFAMALSLCACDTTGPIEGMSSVPVGDGGDSAVESEKGGSSESGSGEKVTLTYFVNSLGDSIIQSYNDSIMYQEVEKILGIDLEFMHSAKNEFSNQLSVMLASGDLPDMIEGFSYNKGPQAAIQDGLIIDMTQLAEEYAPDFMEMLSDPEVKQEVVTDEGTIWCVPCLELHRSPAWRGISVRGDLLEQAGLEKPETISEFKTMLTAFKEMGVDYPLSLWFDYNNGAFQQDGYFVAAYGIGPDWYKDLETGEVKFGPMQDEYLDFITEMHTWYEEGLIDPDFATRKGGDMDSFIVNGEVGAFWSGHGPALNYLANGQAQNPDFELVQVANPSLEKGEVAQMRNKDPINKGNQTVISVSCEHPEEAMRFLNFGYTEEGAMMYNYGVEGVSYTMVDGKPQWTEAMLDGSEGPWVTIREKYKKHTGPYDRDWEAAPLTDFEYQCMEDWSVAGTDLKMPANLSLTAEESEIFNPIMTDIYTYLTENVSAFVNGSRPLEEFDAFRQDLEEMGIQEALEIKIASYERYQNRA